MSTEKKQFCAQCGSPIQEGNKFCPDCGAKVAPTAAEQQSETQSTVTQTNGAQTTGTQATGTQTTQATGTQTTATQAGTQYVNNVPQQTTGYSNQYAGAYAQPQYNRFGTEMAPVMSIGSYILTFFILSIPIVGLIMFFVWAFDNSNPNRRNLVVAQFLWALICFFVALVFFILFASVLAEMFGSYSYYY
jgi:hypothetical protein